MHREEIRRSLHQVCGHSKYMRMGLFRIMDWLTVRSWHVRRELKNWMRSAPAHAHILDAGSGYGHNAYWISCQREKYSVLALDASAERVCSGNAFVRDSKKTNLLFRTFDLEKLESTDAFDLIICTETLEFVRDDDKVIENLHRALRPGGLILTTVNRTPDSGKTVDPDAIRNGYHMADLKQSFKTAGFDKVKGHFTGGTAGQTARKIGIDWPLAMLRVSRVFLALMPFYYALVIPLATLLNWLDSHTAQMSGKGILVLARKQAAHGE